MKKVILLLLLPINAVAQALISNPIQGSPSEPPGMRVQMPGQQVGMDFEIVFRPDSSKIAQSQTEYGCNGVGTIYGSFLYDRHSLDIDGHWLITMSRDGRLCFQDEGSQTGPYWIEFTGVTSDVCHTLTATHSGGQLVVSLDGVSQSITTGVQAPTYTQSSNGVGIGREINGYHDRWGFDSFFGDISYVRDWGTVVDFTDTSLVTGNASLGPNVCGLPPPPPPPPPTACDLDPNSIECACETNPHPACNSCPAS